MRSMEQGHYHLASPDLGQNLLMGSLAGITPRPYLYFAPLLGIVLPLVFAYLRWTIDVVVRKIQGPHAPRESTATPNQTGLSDQLLAKQS